METLSTPQRVSKALNIEQLPLVKASLIVRAVNHSLRQKLLQFLHHRGEACVSEIYHSFQLEQSVVSQHLGILRRVGVVATRREGKQILYSVNYERLRQVQAFAAAVLS